MLGAKTLAVWGAVGVRATPYLLEAKDWCSGTGESAVAAPLHSGSFPSSQGRAHRTLQSTGLQTGASTFTLCLFGIK